jgi:Arc/MetJ-type ribon-helix-helix transcriptional regulator
LPPKAQPDKLKCKDFPGRIAMSTDPSPENEQFIQYAVACGIFHDRGEVLDQAVALLRRQRLVQHIEEGTRQLRNGEGIELNGEDELRAFFDEIQER